MFSQFYHIYLNLSLFYKERVYIKMLLVNIENKNHICKLHTTFLLP